ncbi:MAG: homocysteine biosynthesis protein [Nitrososphaerota archaeon]|nr:homocysteine biosynthesis protein [Candidatus Bathyarchaeota archaeon]MDW8193269.1 homocysteine biosynthesis protein [Nitrososphaerota archaeon]
MTQTSQHVKKTRTVEEINEKIRKGDVQVITAEEMKKLVESSSAEVAFKEVDVVTTGTFGAMCSSGAVINIGHSEPPIKIQNAWINDVPVCHPGAAVDLYIGATMMSETRPFEYGGGHVIEDLISGKEVELRATAYGTDCYPRTRLRTMITKDDLNQFYLVNFRNCYQRYVCAVNSRDETLYTYMGKLLPKFGNATFSGSGELNPLMNDPDYETIGIGTRIFIGGAQGYVIGEGTQHDPKNMQGTLMVRGDCKKMNSRFIRGACFTKYGTTLYVGIGIPIPILNVELAKKTAIKDEDIKVPILDYGIPSRNRPQLGVTSYRDLKSGSIYVNDKKVRVSPLSSLKTAKEIAEILKRWIQEGLFYLTTPVERLPKDTVYRNLRYSEETILVRSVVHPAITCLEDEDVKEVAKRMINHSVNHVVVVDQQCKLRGIVTSWDVTKAVAEGKTELTEIITRKVITTRIDEPIEAASRKMSQYQISALPVIDDEYRVLGIVTSEDIAKLLGRKQNG